ncbi:MAG: hypothetical protein M3Z35_00300, partial [Nitrospirota bacterium]|nr:hypothetical protein [Nitrospirota bacterium]
LIAPWASDMSVDVDTDPVAGEFKQVGTDGYNDAYNTFQGTRVYDPTMAQWTSPDPYAGDVHDPMSQKPFMWNRNNPVSYSDPSGYYVFDNGSHNQRTEFDNTAKEVDKLVSDAMKKLDAGSAEYKNLARLHEDLQKGNGNWHIRFGDPGSNNLARTAVYSNKEHNTLKLTSANPTTVGKLFAGASLVERESTIATEGGLYEIGNGRTGGLLHTVGGDAAYQDYVLPHCGDKCDDHHIDNLTNQLFAHPLGLPNDP